MLYGNVAERCIEVVKEVCFANYANFGIFHLSMSKIVQYIKWKSIRKLQCEFQELRKRYRGQHLWARGYFVAISGQISAKDVQKYIEGRTP